MDNSWEEYVRVLKKGLPAPVVFSLMLQTCAMKLDEHALPVARAGCFLTCVSSLFSSWRLPVSQMVVGCGSGATFLPRTH